MSAPKILNDARMKFGAGVLRADVPADNRLFIYIDAGIVTKFCHYMFRDADARYIVSIGADERPYANRFMVAHNFAFDSEHLLCSVMAHLQEDHPQIDSIASVVPAANWSEREFRDLVGIEPCGHPYPKRLVLPDGWPDGVNPLRKDVPWNFAPPNYDENRVFAFDKTPEGCTVVPFGPFHPTLDEPAHFRLYVEGEMVRGCEYRGFMAHRGIEKLAESVLTYNEIPMAAERICGICGCVHNVAYVQSVEQAAGINVPPRAVFIRTIMLEVERLHSHLLWTGLACHILGFDTMFMQSFRVREPIMRFAEAISGNRKTYSLCLVGGVRWNFTPELKQQLRSVLDKLESEWRVISDAVARDRNIQKRTRGVGVTSPQLVKDAGLIGPVARAAGVPIDCRKDHPYAAYSRVDFDVISESGGDVWARLLVRVKEVFESIKIIRQCLDKMPDGEILTKIDNELPAGRMGMSSVEAPRGESHHFLITGDHNRPYRWRVRAPTYQNLQGIPAMIKDQQLADMTISLGSIDPCFSCTDRMEIVDIKTGQGTFYSQEELIKMVREHFARQE